MEKGDNSKSLYSTQDLKVKSHIIIPFSTLISTIKGSHWIEGEPENYNEKHKKFLNMLDSFSTPYPDGYLVMVTNLSFDSEEEDPDRINGEFAESFISDIASLLESSLRKNSKQKFTEEELELFYSYVKRNILFYLHTLEENKEIKFVVCELPKEGEGGESEQLSLLKLEEGKLIKMNGEIMQVRNIMEDDATRKKVLVPVRLAERYLPKGEPETMKVITSNWKDRSKTVYKDLITGIGKLANLKNRVPEIDQTFLLNRPEYMDFIKLFSKPGFNKIILSGDAGVGKSELVQQVCARMNQPLVRIDFSGEVIAEQIMWSLNFNQESKQMEVVDGIIPFCVRNGVKLCLEEFSAIPPSVAFELHRLFEYGELYIKDNDTVIKAHPNFSIVATDNRIGNPNFQRYYGTQQQNSALISRLKSCIWIPYPDKKLETSYLMLKFPGVEDLVVTNTNSMEQKGLLELIVDFANDVRPKYSEGQLAFTISPRDLIYFFDTFYELEDLNKSFEYAILNFHKGFTSDEQAIMQLFDKYFGKGSKVVNRNKVSKMEGFKINSLLK